MPYIELRASDADGRDNQASRGDTPCQTDTRSALPPSSGLREP